MCVCVWLCPSAGDEKSRTSISMKHFPDYVKKLHSSNDIVSEFFVSLHLYIRSFVSSFISLFVCLFVHSLPRTRSASGVK